MLRIQASIDSLSKLNKHIEFVNKMLKMKSDKNFQKYIQNKCLDTVKEVTEERLTGGTTNDEYISLYKSSNQLRETEDGFVIYNDATIPANDNYPNGEFSIALAFEYGVGITGEGTYANDYFQPWEYNVNQYNFGWYYRKDGELLHSYGYMGFEIYRYAVVKINQKLNNWVNSYYNNLEGA